MNFFLKSSHCSAADSQQSANADFSDAFLPSIELDSTHNSSAFWEEFTLIQHNTFSAISSLADSVSLYSSYNSYTGVIPSPYLDYIRDIRLQYLDRDYVSFVTQETKYVNNSTYRSTVYNIFVSDSLDFNGNSYTGSGILYKYYSSPSLYFPTYSSTLDSSFYFAPGSGAVWSSLPGSAPDFCRSVYGPYYCLFFMFFIFIYFCFSKFFVFLRRKV